MQKSSFVCIFQWTITIGSLAVVLYSINTSEFFLNFTSIHLIYLFAGFVLAFFQFIVGAWRWKQIIILIANISVSTLDLLKIYLISFFASFLLPGTITSDIYRMYDTRQMVGNSAASSFAVIFERALSLLVLVVWSGISWLSLEQKPAINFSGGKIILAGVVVIFLILAIMLLLAKTKIEFFLKIRGWLNHIFHIAASIPNLILKNPLRMVAIILTSFLFQITALLIILSALRAADVDIGFLEFFVIGSIVSLIIILPISIQGIGIREFLYLSLMAQYGINSEDLVTGLALTYFIGLPFVFWGWYLFTRRAIGTNKGAILK